MCAILLEGLTLFTWCLALHVVIWRIRRPTTWAQWLTALVMVFLVAGPGVGWLIVQPAFLDDSGLPPLTEWLALMLLHGPLSAVYIIGYTLISGFSPSVEILKLLERTPGGLLRAEVDLPFLRDALGGDRVGNLLAGGLIRHVGQEVQLAPGARVLTAVVSSYRQLLGLPERGGG